MRRTTKRQFFHSMLCSVCLTCGGGIYAQEPTSKLKPTQSLMILTASSDETPIRLTSQETSEFIVDETELNRSSIPTDENDSDTIRERFPDGKIRIERKVALDSEGNYINHGPYQEWTNKGDLVATGSFEMGKRQGPWIQMSDSKTSKLMTTYPYSKFKAPFQSSVEFTEGAMDGVWTITDADSKIVSQIQLAMGRREGTTTFYHPTGQIQFQAEYRGGLLHGLAIEKGLEGKVVKDERFTSGQRTEVVQEFYPSKTLKSEVRYLTAPQKLVAADNFEKLMLAEYKAEGERIQDGSFMTYHSNGQMKSKGVYERGRLVGSFESWHPNGQMAVTGSYAQGTQNGKWTWWHENGMRQSMAEYSQGKATGEILAWNDQGKRVTSPKSLMESGVEPSKEFPVSTPKTQGSFR